MGAIADQITAAIGAHGAWKRRLSDAIESGRDASTPDKVQVDNICPFGQWLYGPDTSAFRGDPNYVKCKALHADFHKAAAGVLELALAGQKAQAVAAMGMGSPYSTTSAKLTTAMMAWQTATK